MAKEEKTPKELKALLDERIARYQLGREVNPRWVKIAPADPAKEGANWKVSHTRAAACVASSLIKIQAVTALQK